MARTLLILALYVWITGCSQQENKPLLPEPDSFYNYFKPGDFSVGFCDTVIFDADLRFEFLPDTTVSYKQYNYEGPTPMFVQIWYPMTEKPGGPPLTYGQLRDRNLTSSLKSVYEPLFQKADSFFVNFNVNWHIKSLDPLKWGKQSYDSLDGYQVLEILKGYPTQSHYQKLNAPKNFPLIVYHHGAQSQSDENFVLAEYFASRGYVVVSANFHLPFEKRMWGYEGIVFDDTKLPKTLLNFSKTLIEDDNKVFFMGHSAGAQVGFKFLFDTDIDAFVSLETTMEGEEKEDLLSEDGWPDVANEIEKHKDEYDFLILMIANTKDDKPFNLFNEIVSPRMLQVSAKSPFTHDAYTSGFHLRHMYRNQLKQPDTLAMSNQLDLYFKNLKLIESFIEKSGDEKFEFPKKLQADFYFNLLGD